MGNPTTEEKQKAPAACNEFESGFMGMSMMPPVFKLFCGDDKSATPVAKQEQSDGPPNPYAGFAATMEKVLSCDDSFLEGTLLDSWGIYHNPSLPSECNAVITKVYRARFWKAGYEKSPQEFARLALADMAALKPTLEGNGILANPVLSQMRAVLAPILNPDSGSADASSLSSALQAAILQYQLNAPLDKKGQDQLEYAERMNRVLNAAANILSPELSAEIPGQILNPASPYNFLSYKASKEIGDTNMRGLTALFRARWEAKKMKTRLEKLEFGREQGLKSLLDPKKHRKMLRALTGLNEAGIEQQAAVIQGAIQKYILDRLDAIAADPVLTPIAKNGLALPPDKARSSNTKKKKVADIAYADDREVTKWEVTPETTLAETRETLGDDPRKTLDGSNIGAYNKPGKKYPFHHKGRKYQILTDAAREYFGIKYEGNSGMTNAAIDELLDSDAYFNDMERAVIGAARPQVRTEGGISSVNTWDKQLITIAGRGEFSGRISVLINVAKSLMADAGTPLSALDEVQAKVNALNQPAAPCVAGQRFNMVAIHGLVELLETPEIHKALTLAKLNDVIVNFFGKPLVVKDQVTRYDKDIPKEDHDRLRKEIKHNKLNPSIMGIAIHNRLGTSAFKDPMEYAIRANKAFPQRPMYVNANMPDYEQLSKQVAYMGKIRFQMLSRQKDGSRGLSMRNFKIILSQKITDFNDYFANEGAAKENGSYFRMDAATSVLPFWTGDRDFTPAGKKPGPDRLFLKNGEGKETQYWDCGPLLADGATSLDQESDFEKIY